MYATARKGLCQPDCMLCWVNVGQCLANAYNIGLLLAQCSLLCVQGQLVFISKVSYQTIQFSIRPCWCYLSIKQCRHGVGEVHNLLTSISIAMKYSGEHEGRIETSQLLICEGQGMHCHQSLTY